MQLKTKFIIFIGLVICCSFGVTFYRTSSYQEELVVEMATRQAKMLFHQIRITRQWVADHNGLFLVKAPGVEENPFLAEGKIQDEAGNWLFKRNPAMVTRELSLYAARAGMGHFNVTSLKPVNPANAPDDFERHSLVEFAAGVQEVMTIEQVDGRHRLRYMAPLEVEERCLDCHQDQGYAIGDIRGAMHVTIPIDWAFDEIRTNNRMLLNIGVGTVLTVALLIYLMFDRLVVTRLKMLAGEMDQYPHQQGRRSLTRAQKQDEIGTLAHHFHKLCQRLDRSQQELDLTRDQVFRAEKLAALGRLVAGVSHEINNPLGGMQNCIQTLRKNPDDPEKVCRYLELLNQGVERIKQTVQQLLKIGRKEPVTLQLGNVDQMIAECVELSCMGRRNIRFETQLAVPQPVLVSMEALRQVIVNLTGNAVQAMAEDGGVLTVTSREDGIRLMVEIADTGPGIPQQHLDKIFEPFFTTKQVGEGTGLGLSVSYALVERMGGELTGGNRPGGGAVFSLWIPLGRAPELAGEYI